MFEPIISARHGGYARNAVHPTDMDINNVLDTKIDPDGKYVLTSRVRTGRSVRGIRLPPSIEFLERRELERVCVKGLLNLKGNLKVCWRTIHERHLHLSTILFLVCDSKHHHRETTSP